MFSSKLFRVLVGSWDAYKEERSKCIIVSKPHANLINSVCIAGLSNDWVHIRAHLYTRVSVLWKPLHSRYSAGL